MRASLEGAPPVAKRADRNPEGGRVRKEDSARLGSLEGRWKTSAEKEKV